MCCARPEKDHAAQLRAFAELLARYPEHRASENDGGVRLVLVGGSRNEGDATRVEGLRQLAKHLKIDVCAYSYIPSSFVKKWKDLMRSTGPDRLRH